jgi:hypothetical protein
MHLAARSHRNEQEMLRRWGKNHFIRSGSFRASPGNA